MKILKKKKMENKNVIHKMVDLLGFINISASPINHQSYSISNPRKVINSKTFK